MPPISLIRAAFASRKPWSCSADRTRKSERSRAASRASSPIRSVRFASIAGASFSIRCPGRRRPVLGVVFEVGAHPLPEEHRVVPFEDPLARPMAERAGSLVGLQLVECGVVGQIQEDHVVEVPAVGHVVHCLSLIHISEPTRLGMISYAVFCLNKKKK